MCDEDKLIEHLVESGLAGDVQTPPSNTMAKTERLLGGDPTCTFGLSDWSHASLDDIARALEVTAGADLFMADAEYGYIDPRRTVAGIERYGRLLAPYLARGCSNVLLATGHPTGLLEHYIELARVLESTGNRLLITHDDGPAITPGKGPEAERTVRFVGSVACVYDGLSLVHSHLSAYMEVMLDDLARAGVRVDLVIGDHGMAGAAVERGIPALSIADVNDPGLPLAYLNGRHDGLFVIDDNLPPQLFRPVTDYVLHIARANASESREAGR